MGILVLLMVVIVIGLVWWGIYSWRRGEEEAIAEAKVEKERIAQKIAQGIDPAGFAGLLKESGLPAVGGPKELIGLPFSVRTATEYGGVKVYSATVIGVEVDLDSRIFGRYISLDGEKDDFGVFYSSKDGYWRTSKEGWQCTPEFGDILGGIDRPVLAPPLPDQTLRAMEEAGMPTVFPDQAIGRKAEMISGAGCAWGIVTGVGVRHGFVCVDVLVSPNVFHFLGSEKEWQHIFFQPTMEKWCISMTENVLDAFRLLPE